MYDLATSIFVSEYTSHTKLRNVVERCNGLLKGRFRCLLKHRTMHYQPSVASKIINACACLHNWCIENNIDSDCNSDMSEEGGTDNESYDEAQTNIQTASQMRQIAAQLRSNLAQNLHYN